MIIYIVLSYPILYLLIRPISKDCEVERRRDIRFLAAAPLSLIVLAALWVIYVTLSLIIDILDCVYCWRSR